MQKARETGDFGFNARAEAALDHSLELSPDDPLTLTMQATLLLTYHRFAEALAGAKRIQASGPDSAELCGIMTDAQVELGDYEEAIKSAQKMMNLRPDAAAYARVSYLRALHGDVDGAICRSGERDGRADPGHAQDDSRLAAVREVCRHLRRRKKPPSRFGRYGSYQRQSSGGLEA